jgi:predicted RNA-binding protein
VRWRKENTYGTKDKGHIAGKIASKEAKQEEEEADYKRVTQLHKLTAPCN